MENLENNVEVLRGDIQLLRTENGDLRETIAKEEFEISEVLWRVSALKEEV